jgi:hypothetical protein
MQHRTYSYSRPAAHPAGSLELVVCHGNIHRHDASSEVLGMVVWCCMACKVLDETQKVNLSLATSWLTPIS